MTAPTDIAALIARLRDIPRESDEGWYWEPLCDEAADALEACARDAARWQFCRESTHRGPSLIVSVSPDGTNTNKVIESRAEWIKFEAMIDAAIDRARGEP